MVSLTVVALVLHVTFATTVIMDFNGITSPSSTHIAKYDVDDETRENDPNIGTEFTTEMYEAISSKDETYTVTRVTYEYFYSQQIFRFKVESVPIEEFTVTWEGNIAFIWVGVYHTEGIEIWNNSTGSWEWVGSVSAVGDFETYPGPPKGASVQGRMAFMTPDETITKTYTENISNYIDNGYITVMVWAKNCHDATICTDYVKLECKPPKHYLKVVSPYGMSGGEGWYDEGTIAYATLDTGIVDHGNGTRRVFSHWGEDASGTNYTASDPIYMSQNKTAIANWKTQYLVTFSQTGLDDTATGTVVTLNGVTRSFKDLPFSMWVDSGTVITYFYSNVSSIISGKRFVLTGLTGQLSPITVTSPVTVTGNYKTQCRITFNQSGVGPDFAGTVVTIDGTGYAVGTLPASFWWNKDSTHTFSVSSPLIISASKQYVWISTAGLSTLQSGTLTITDSGSITGNYKIQYYLTVSSPYGSPSPSSGWFDAGVSVTASVTSPWPGPAATRYVCTGWTGAGSVSASGTATAVTFTINQPSSIAWNWKTQYYLTVKTDPAGITTIPGEGWYNESASVTLTAPTVPNYQFNYWDVDGTSQGGGVNPITVHMNKPCTATGHYAPAAPPPSVSISPLSASIYVGQSVTFTSTVSGGTPPYNYQWYLNGNPASGVTSSTWTFKPTTIGIYYIYLKVTDAYNMFAQSETARIVVSVVPVGGYSISSTRAVATTPLICYTILLAIFGATISLIKRKRK